MTDVTFSRNSGGGSTGFSRSSRTPAPQVNFSRGQRMGLGKKVGGFFLSTLESFPELFGIEPTQATQEFRAQAPVSGAVSQMVGAFVPYVGAAKVARALPLTGRFIRGAEALGRGPVSRAALGMGAEAAVVEAARVGAGVSPIPEAVYEGVTGRDAETRGFGTLAGEAAFNIAGSAVLGGAAGGIIDRIRRGVRIQDIVPGASPDRPLVQQIRALNEEIAARQANGADDPLLERLARERQNRINWNLADVETQYTTSGEAIRSGKYRSEAGTLYRPLAGERKYSSGSGEISGFLGRLANWKSKSPDRLNETRRLIVTGAEPGGFGTQEALDEVMSRIGMDRETFGMYALDPRVVRVREGQGRPQGSAKPLPETGDRSLDPLQAAGRRLHSSDPVYGKTTGVQGKANGIERRFMSRVFKDVGDGWRMARENDGLYVMARKINGEIGSPRPGDQWVFFRTDRPDVFAKTSAKTNDLFMRSDYLPEPIAQMKTGESLWDHAVDLQETFANELPNVKRTRTRLGAVGSAVRESGETLASYATPTNPLVYKNPVMARAFNLIKGMDAFVETRVDLIMRGMRKFDDKKSLVRNFMDLDPPKTNGMDDFIRGMSKSELEQVKYVLETETPFDQLEEVFAAKLLDENGEPLISDNVMDFFRRMEMISESLLSRSKKLDGILAQSDAKKVLDELMLRKGHYGLTREFPGTYRIFLTDAKGEIVGIASEHSATAAKEAAQVLIEQEAKRGRAIFEGGLMDETLLNTETVQKLRKAAVKPGFLKNRGDLLGYEYSRGELTADRLSKLVETNLRRRENWLKEVVMREMMAEPIAQLSRQDAKLGEELTKIMNRALGDEGAFARVQNAMMDKVLHSVGFTGKDTASGIVRTTQSLLNSFQMAFGNVTQPLLNGIGIFQTVFPETAYVLHASPEVLARNYVTVPLVDGANNVTGSLGILSEVKVMNNAFKRIGTSWEKQEPEFKQLISDLISDRSLSPRYAEEQFGANGAILKNATEGFKDTQSFIRLINSANEIMLSKTEELNRLVSVSTAYELGTLKGLSGLQLKVFAREFLAKTAFNYGTVDRAAIFTTPLGSLMGTFKNWMFHYMANIVRYSTSGKEALPALFWQTASTGLIGGAAATPLVMPVADAFSKWATGGETMEWIYNAVGPDNSWVADGLIYGLPGMMGISFASQAASPGADPERDAQMLFSFAAWDRVKNLSIGTRDALNAWRITGESPWEDENVRREMVRALAPRTFYRGMASAENNAITSMATGYPVMEGLGVGDALMYSAGFNPRELEKTYEVYNLVKNEQRAKKALVQEYGQTLAQAWESGDQRLANRVFARAMATGVDMSSVLRSAKARQDRMGETQLEAAIDPEQSARFGAIIGQ